MAFGALSLKGRALRCLAQREFSRAELARKLYPHALRSLRAADARDEDEDRGEDRGDDLDHDHDDSTLAQQASQQVDTLLAELQALGLLSDERAAASVLQLQGARSGQRRLGQLLQAKGLGAELVGQTLAQARSTEFERAWALWLRRYGQPPEDAASRARQQRYLHGRGFSFEVIQRVMRQANDAAAGPETGLDP